MSSSFKPGILFQGRYGHCTVPLELLTLAEKRLIERKGCTLHGDDDQHPFMYYWGIPIHDFPSIFYNKTSSPFFDTHFPRYLQALSGLPATNTPQELQMSAIQLFQQDIEDLSLDFFYDNLIQIFQSKNLKVEYDDEEFVSACVANKPPFIITFGKPFKENHFDFSWFTACMLHEVYHFVEFELRSHNVANLFKQHPRFEVFSQNDYSRRYSKHYVEPLDRSGDIIKYHPAGISIIRWNYGSIETAPFMHLAEMLAALTFVEKPQLKELVMPYYNILCEQAKCEPFWV